jgi:hypothetical protein
VQFRLRGESPEPLEVRIGAFPELLVRLIPPVPSGVKVMIEVAHGDAKALNITRTPALDLGKSPVQLLRSFTEMEGNDLSIHSNAEQIMGLILGVVKTVIGR